MLGKKIILARIFVTLFSAIALNGIAGTMYWVDNGGNWNDPRHWSHSSGGHGGAGIPGSNDDVVFDENSFTNPYEQVNISGIAACHSLQWMPDVTYAELYGSALSSLDIYGSASILDPLDFKYKGSIHFKSSQQGNTINLGVGKLGNLYFEGSGSWKLGAIIYASNLNLSSGELIANGFEVACTNLNITGYSKKTIDITNSMLFIEQQLNQQNSGNFKINSSDNTKIIYRHYLVNSLNATAHATHRPMSVDSSHYVITPPTCNINDTGATCNGKIFITKIYSSDTGHYSYSFSANGGIFTGSDSLTGQCGNIIGTYYTIYDSSDNSYSAPQYYTITAPNRLSFGFSSVREPKCNGACDGWINYCVSGETGPYTYFWYGGGPSGATSGCPNYLYDSSLCAGSYRIYIRDSKGCHSSLFPPITLKAVSSVSVTVTSTPPSCNTNCNGTATATAKGGHGPPSGTSSYTYSWSPGGQTTKTATNLCAGTYTVTAVDDSGCSASTTVTIIAPTAVNVTITGESNVTCFSACNGSASAAASGGTPGYTYTWSPGGETSNPAVNLCGTVAGTVYQVVAKDKNGCKDSATVTITEPNPLTVSISTTNNPLTCSGNCNASASASVSGGTAPYSYSWNNGNTSAAISNLCVGKYIVTVTDNNGCTTKDSVTITQPNPINVTVNSIVNPPCNGACSGSISTTASGGTAPYTYDWSPVGQTTDSASNLCIGTYTLTVTDHNGCTNSGTVETLTQPTPVSVSLNIDEVSCNGSCNGKVFATASGGTVPYTYQWNGGVIGTTDSITGVCSGAGKVTVKDSNLCSTTKFYTVTEPNPLSTLISHQNSTCTACNGSAKVTVLGGTPPYNYKWTTVPEQTTDSAANLCAGTYTVNITDNDSCKITQSVTIVPTVTITITSSASGLACFGSCDGIATANASGGSLPYIYTWSCIPPQTTATATGLCAGSYTINVHDADGCTNTDSVQFINPPQLVGSTSQTNVSCNGSCVGTACDTASGGTPPYTYLWSDGETTSCISGLCVGQYTVKITDSKLCNITDTVTITEAPPLAANPTVVTPACGFSTGSITLAPTGGVGNYTYLWSPGAQTTENISGLPAGTYSVTITDSLGCSHTFAIPVSNIAGPTLGHVLTNDNCWNSCNGYDSVYIVTGTTAPYTFLWSTGNTTSSISNLCAGPYICTVTDKNGCITNEADTIQEPNELNPNATVQNLSCHGSDDGSISFATTGGTGPYTYTWSPPASTTSSAINLTPGVYTFTIADSKGCDTIFSLTVTEPNVLSVAMTYTNVLCHGLCNGEAEGTVSGGTPPYLYSWSNGAVLNKDVGLCPLGYTLNVTDGNGCTTSGNVTITQPTVLTGIISDTNVSCNLGSNGVALITVSGGTTPYSYSWSDGLSTSSITNLSVGTYVVTVNDSNNCNITDSITLTQPGPINISIAPTNATCNADCNGSAIATVTGGTSPYTYSWSTLPGQTTDTATGLCAGSYTLNITDSNKCTASNSVSISQPTPISANISSTNTKCPTSCDGTATSSPVGGTPPYTYLWPGGFTTDSVSGLCAGSYSVIVKDYNLCTDTGKVTITNPAPITASAATAASSCGQCNGSISVSPSGGTPGYSFAWSDSRTADTVNNICAGIYTYTVTDANSCVASFTVILNNSGGPTSVAFSNTNATCFDSCNGSIIVTPTGGMPSYTYTFNGGLQQSSDTGKNLCAGSYTIVVTDNSGCQLTDTTSLTQPATAVTATGAATNAQCLGICTGTINVTASGGVPPYTYQWSGGQSSSSLAGLCPGNDTVVITDANLCPLKQVYAVGQNVAITPSVNFTSPLCHDSCTGTATASAIGGASPYTYIWSNGATGSNISALCAGNYTDTVKDQNGCKAIDSAFIKPPSAISVTFNDTLIGCNDSCNGKAFANASGGTPGYTYLWAGSGLTTDSLTSLCAGTYSITVTDKNNCVLDTATTLVNPAILAATDTDSTATCGVCNGAIMVTPSGGTPAYNFLWSNAETTDTIINICAGVYTYTITDAHHCTASYTVILNNTGGPTGVTLTESNDSCNGLCDGFISVSPIGGTSPYTYSFNGVQALGNDTSDICPGTYTIVVTDNLGCKYFDTSSITQPASLSVNGVSTNATCIGICNGTINVAVTGGTPPYSYQWSGGQTNSPVASGVCPGNDTVTVTDAHLCSFKKVFTVGQNIVISDTLTSTNPLCHDSCTGTATAIVNGGGTPPYTYSWSNGNTNSNISALCAGNYTDTIKDANGCEAIDTAFIVQPTAMMVTFSDSIISCNNSCDGKAFATVSGGTPGYTYMWDSVAAQTNDAITNICAGTYYIAITDNNGCIFDTGITLANPPVLTNNNIVTNASCNSTNDGMIIATPAGGVPPYYFKWSNGVTTATNSNLLPGTYTLTLTDSTNCVLVDSAKVLADTTVIAKIGYDSAICATNSDTLNGTMSVNAATYEWFTMPGRIPVGSTDTIIVTPANTTQYVLLVTDGTCTDSMTVNVTVNPLPIVRTGGMQTIYLYTSATLGGSPTGPAGSTYSWSPGTGMKDSTVANPVVSPTVTTIYTVTVKSSAGCSVTDTVTIKVIPNFTPTSGFTPNGDGINDTWQLALGNFPNSTVEVFNRWGEKVFSSDIGYSKPWDGTYNGDPLPVGTYYYVINLHDTRFPNAYTGPVTIMR
ncbi:MAG: gliding motility-associated C-terminal domain-containing protein [Bacteroidia bacterium]